jgi:outer membrane immunogenic protein
MKELVLAGLALGALAAPAAAADMPVKAPPPPPFGWTGFYIGANAGWGTLRDEDAPFCINPAGVVMGKGCSRVFGGQVRGDGFIGGGQAGYDWQSGRWVLGVETDIQGADVIGSDNVAGPFSVVGSKVLSPAASFAANEKLSWLGTTRGRLGLAFDHLLLYATGGVAYGEASVSQSLVFPTVPVQFPSSASATMTGWAAGGGLEYAFLGNWSAKFEGMFYDLGTITTSGVASPHINNFVEGKAFKVEGAVARVGINWRFGGLGWYGL